MNALRPRGSQAATARLRLLRDTRNQIKNAIAARTAIATRIQIHASLLVEEDAAGTVVVVVVLTGWVVVGVTTVVGATVGLGETAVVGGVVVGIVVGTVVGASVGAVVGAVVAGGIVVATASLWVVEGSSALVVVGASASSLEEGEVGREVWGRLEVVIPGLLPEEPELHAPSATAQIPATRSNLIPDRTRCA